jgi:hypothetical protein
MNGVPAVVASLREHATNALDHADHQCPTYYLELGAAMALYAVVGAMGYDPDEALGPTLLARLENYRGDESARLDVQPIPDTSPDDPEPIPAPGLPPITAAEIEACDLDSLAWVLVDSHPDSQTYHGDTDR